jgi:hypothetical protein
MLYFAAVKCDIASSHFAATDWRCRNLSAARHASQDDQSHLKDNKQLLTTPLSLKKATN